jgi:hypothetical protein
MYYIDNKQSYLASVRANNTLGTIEEDELLKAKLEYEKTNKSLVLLRIPGKGVPQPTYEELEIESAQRRYLPTLPIGIWRDEHDASIVYPHRINSGWKNDDGTIENIRSNFYITYESSHKRDAYDMVNSIVVRFLLAFSPGAVHLSLINPYRCNGDKWLTDNINNIADKVSNKDEKEELLNLFNGHSFVKDDEIHKQLEVLTTLMESAGSKLQQARVASLSEYYAKNLGADIASQSYELVVLYEPFTTGGNSQLLRNITALLKNHTESGIYFVIVQDESLADPHQMEKISDMDEYTDLYIDGKSQWREREQDGDKIESYFFTSIQEYCHQEKCQDIFTVEKDFSNRSSNPLLYDFFINYGKQICSRKEKFSLKKWEALPLEYAWDKFIVPIGTNYEDENETINFELNEKDAAHAFIMGMTGSGKSVLFKDIFASAALHYHPRSLRFYMIDFKDGLSFQSFEKNGKAIPHVDWLMLKTANKDLFLQLLHTIEKEKDERGLKFRERGVDSLAAYNQMVHNLNIQNGEEDEYTGMIPRVIIGIDEVQKAFIKSGDDNGKTAEISKILSSFALEARAYGIHLIFATQQFGEIPKTFIDQFCTNSYVLNSGGVHPGALLAEKDQGVVPSMLAVRKYVAYSRRNGAYVKSYYIPNDEEQKLVSTVRTKVSKDIKGDIDVLFKPFVYKGTVKPEIFSLRSPYRINTITFGTNSIASGEVTERITAKDGQNILIIGNAGKEDATMLTMRMVLSTLKYPLINVVNCQNNVVSPPTIFMINALEDDYDYGDSPIENENSLLRELHEQHFINLLQKRDLATILSKLMKEVDDRNATDDRGGKSLIMLYVLGYKNISDLYKNVHPDEQPVKQSKDEISIDTFDLTGGNKKRGAGLGLRDMLTYIIENGPSQNIHVILQANKKDDISSNDLGSKSINVKSFNYIVFQASNESFVSWEGVSELIMSPRSLSTNPEDARAILYSRDGDQQLIVPYYVARKDTFIEELKNM